MNFISSSTKPNIFRRVGSFLASPGGLACFLLPPALWLAALVIGLHVPAPVAAGTKAVAVFYYAAAISCAACAWRAFFSKRRGAGLIWLGMLLVLLQGVLWYGLRFRAVAEIGDSDRLAGYVVSEPGRWVRFPLPDIAVRSVWSGKSGDVRLALGGKEREVKVGKRTFWHGYSLKPTVRGIAPLFLLDDAVGETDKAGYFPLGTAGTKYFQLGELPHRFYVTGATPPAPGPEAMRRPDTLKITITREKLVVFKGEMKKGENVEFEGHRLRFEDGAPWIRLEITRLWEFLPLLPAAALMATGMVFSGRKAEG